MSQKLCKDQKLGAIKICDVLDVYGAQSYDMKPTPMLATCFCFMNSKWSRTLFRKFVADGQTFSSLLVHLENLTNYHHIILSYIFCFTLWISQVYFDCKLRWKSHAQKRLISLEFQIIFKQTRFSNRQKIFFFAFSFVLIFKSGQIIILPTNSVPAFVK